MEPDRARPRGAGVEVGDQRQRRRHVERLADAHQRAGREQQLVVVVRGEVVVVPRGLLVGGERVLGRGRGHVDERPSDRSVSFQPIIGGRNRPWMNSCGERPAGDASCSPGNTPATPTRRRTSPRTHCCARGGASIRSRAGAVLPMAGGDRSQRGSSDRGEAVAATRPRGNPRGGRGGPSGCPRRGSGRPRSGLATPRRERPGADPHALRGRPHPGGDCA